MKNHEMVNAQGRAGTNFVKTDEMKAVIDRLNDLIAADYGVAEVYETAVTRLEDPTNRTLLQDYAKQYKGFAAELANLVVRHDGDPATAADGSSLVQRAWVTLKATVTEGEGPVMTEAADSANHVLEEYMEAMDTDLPDDVRDVVRHHLSAARLTHEKLSGLSAAYNS